MTYPIRFIVPVLQCPKPEVFENRPTNLCLFCGFRNATRDVPAFRHGAAVAEARAPRPLLFPNPWEYAVEAIISWADAHPFLIVCKPRPVVRIRIRRCVVRIRIGDAAISVTVVVRTGENTTDWDLLPFRRKIMDNNSKSIIPAYFLPTALCAFSLFRFALLWLL